MVGNRPPCQFNLLQAKGTTMKATLDQLLNDVETLDPLTEPSTFNPPPQPKENTMKTPIDMQAINQHLSQYDLPKPIKTAMLAKLHEVEEFKFFENIKKTESACHSNFYTFKGTIHIVFDHYQEHKVAMIGTAMTIAQACWLKKSADAITPDQIPRLIKCRNATMKALFAVSDTIGNDWKNPNKQPISGDYEVYDLHETLIQAMLTLQYQINPILCPMYANNEWEDFFDICGEDTTDNVMWTKKDLKTFFDQ